MKLVLLGTGGYFPTSRRNTACMMLPEFGIVLDAGSGMCHIDKHLATDRLDIFLSHAHLDHIAGLTYLISLASRAVQARTTVHGNEAKLAAVRDHLFDEVIFPVPPRFNFAPLTGPCDLPEGGKLEYFPLKHPGGSLGFRLDWPGHSMAYVTDTTAVANADYIDSIRGVDLLLHEAFFAEDKGTLAANIGHSCLPAVVELAAAAQVRRLVLVHIDPQIESDSAFDLSAARRVFASCELGTDGMELHF